MTRLFATSFFIAVFICSLIVLGSPPIAQAQFHQQNNKVALHLISASDEDLREACRAVGEWGWVVLVVGENEYTPEKLQSLHDIARDEKCLIFHRLATKFNGSNAWLRPTIKTTDYIVNLCKNVTPSSKYFYVSLLNEVNRGDEYDGEVDATHYAHWAEDAKTRLNTECPHSVVTFAGLDKASPQQPPLYVDAGQFYRDMIVAEPTIFNGIDAITTHDYPPHMTGSCTAVGRRSIVGYRWEKELLRNLGVAHAGQMKVFITESGWRVGPSVTETESATNTQCALQILQQDDDVQLAGRFVYKFCGEPFASFSLYNCETSQLNQIGQVVRGIAKTPGDPEHVYKATTLANLTKNIVEDQPIEIPLRIVNNGTDNFRRGEYELALLGSQFQYSFTDFDLVRPKGTLATTFTFNPGKVEGCPTVRVGLKKKGRVIFELFEWQACVYKAPDLELIGLKTPLSSVKNAPAEAQVFSMDEKFLSRAKATIQDGIVTFSELKGVNFDTQYRIVLLVPGSLPQQWYMSFVPGKNVIEPRTLWPIDNNEDGKLSLGDILSLYSAK